jgi:hypothetical protein
MLHSFLGSRIEIPSRQARCIAAYFWNSYPDLLIRCQYVNSSRQNEAVFIIHVCGYTIRTTQIFDVYGKATSGPCFSGGVLVLLEHHSRCRSIALNSLSVPPYCSSTQYVAIDLSERP